jgi:hypothetical protein
MATKKQPHNTPSKPYRLLNLLSPLFLLGIHNTFLDLLPENVAKKSPIWPLSNTMKPGIGCLSVFIGLRGTTEELGLKAENLWVFTESSNQKVDNYFSAIKLWPSNDVVSFFK